jgi:hypothetical protein
LSEFINEIIEKLRASGMDLEVEGEVAGFLGVHIQRDVQEGTITLTQKGLIKRIIEAVGSGSLPAQSVPADSVPLVKDEHGEPIDDTFNYSSEVGMLQYLQNHTRPDITYAVSQCARFVHSPRRSHEISIMRICRYLKGTDDKGLIFKPASTLKIDCYVEKNSSSFNKT